jgi:acetyl/propionyl-CoA carboxylase alpha subunit
MQRSHQKVIEEAPAPNLPKPIRDAIHRATERIFLASRYVGAGTAEFLFDGHEAFYFLEVNSRIQVEHPVTELVLGLDLIGLQLDIAMGGRLDELVSSTEPRGSAIEVRLCAEVPHENFHPSSGCLAVVRFPPEGAGVRVDTGYVAGDVVPHAYDSLLAKIMVHAPTREEARTRLAALLQRCAIAGVHTNLQFLERLLRAEQFQLVTHATSLAQTLVGTPEEQEDAALEVAAWWVVARMVGSSSDGGFAQRDGWRILGRGGTERRLIVDNRPVTVRCTIGGPRHFTMDIQPAEGEARSRRFHLFGVEREDPNTVIGYTNGGERVRGELLAPGWFATPRGIFRIEESLPTLSRVDQERGAAVRRITAALPGRVLSVHTTQGSEIRKNDIIAILESMKMEHPVRAPIDGRVDTVGVTAGAIVESNTVVAIIATVAEVERSI